MNLEITGLRLHQDSLPTKEGTLKSPPSYSMEVQSGETSFSVDIGADTFVTLVGFLKNEDETAEETNV